MSDKRQFPWIGIILMLAGVALLLEKLDVLSLSTPALLWILLLLFGLAMVVQGFSGNNGGRVFFGTIFFLYGLYFLLHSIDAVELRGHLFIPASFIIFGFAFVMLYLNNLREWLFLLPAVLLLGFGVLYIMGTLGYFTAWDVHETVRLYWPIGLIIIGVAIVLRRRVAARSHMSTSLPGEPPQPPAQGS